MSRALRDAAIANGATVRTDAAVARIDVRNGRVRGVTLESGEELRADVVVAATHPQITFLRADRPRAQLPTDFVERIERWRSRSGTVKVNVAVDRLPEFTAKPGFDPEVHGGTIVLAESLDDIEGAFQDAVAGRAAALPFADICIPSVFDPTLAPEGKHVVSMFTQWVPHTYATEPDQAELDAYADRVIARVDAVAPGFTDSILHRQVIGPYEMEHEYGLDRRQHLPRRAVARPDVPHAARARLRRLPHADRRPVPGEQRDARRRRRDRHPRPARDASDHAR